MKCPNCGAEMSEGSLYCEHCGEDIHIVPDYEPEVEFNISQSLHHIMEDVKQETQRQDNMEKELFREEERFRESGREWAEYREDAEDWSSGHFAADRASGEDDRHKRVVLLALGICGLLLLILAGTGGLMAYQHNSYEYQLQKAISYTAQDKYEKAIAYYNRALELDSKDIEVRFALAEAYLMKGNKIEYEYLLRDIIRDENANEDQLERAYGKLITIYKARSEYDTIHEILQASKSEKIKETYQNYIAKAPEFSYQEGSYTEIVPLKLTSVAEGKIYYTLDGSEPDESSLLYTAPIFLDNGDYVIKAYFVNEYGVASECVTKEYHISIELVSAPEISVISGDYYVPTLIEVMDLEDQEVYYTTDGTDPDRHSTPYTRPIPMPLGKSHYKFVYVMEDGSISDIAEYQYHLRLNTQFTEKDAESVIVEYMLYTRKIYNYEGNFSTESAGQYKYQYQYTISIAESGDFYVIAEIYKDEEGVSVRTGSYFAVDIYTGEYYKLQIDENNNYTIVEILLDSQEE